MLHDGVGLCFADCVAASGGLWLASGVLVRQDQATLCWQVIMVAKVIGFSWSVLLLLATELAPQRSIQQ